MDPDPAGPAEGGAPGDTNADTDRDTDRLSADARAAFREAFGRDAAVAAFAPGRVNLIGDHTDYNDGFVMPLAIDAGCVCVAGDRGPRGSLSAVAVDLGERASRDAEKPLEPDALADGPAWFRYVAGVFEEYRLASGLDDLSGVELAVTSSVPPGSGLSSSAALEVAVATALEELAGVPLEPLSKARLAQTAEHRFAGVPCGLMDQLASTFGRAGHALRIDCRDHRVEPTPLPDPAAVSFVIVDSMVKHDNASGTYAERRAACERAAEKLGLSALRDLPEGWQDGAAGLLDGDEFTAARHVAGENARVLAFADALAAGDLPDAGRLMTESHRSLAELYRVSCDELDLLVDLLTARPGVHGARLSGAGLGGWVVAMVDTPARDEAVAATREAFRAAHGVEPRWRSVEARDGCRLL